MNFRRFATVSLLVGACTALLAPAAANADAVVRDGLEQRFDATVKVGKKLPTDKVDAPYTFALNWTTKSLATAVAPPVTDVEIKLPAGVELRKQFQSGNTVCGMSALATRNPKACPKALIGTGEVQLDFQPFTSATVPADVYVFLGAAPPGAVGALLIMAIPRASDPFVAANAVVRDTKPIITAPIYRDSTTGFGLRMEMPIDIEAPIVVSIRSFSITMVGNGIKKSKGKKLFWASQPACKKSAKFQASFSYIGVSSVTVDSTVPVKFKCPKKAKKKKKKKK